MGIGIQFGRHLDQLYWLGCYHGRLRTILRIVTSRPSADGRTGTCPTV